MWFKNKTTIEDWREHFLECFKYQLRKAGIEPDSDAERLILFCLAQAAQQWVREVRER